jgi:hypothetical protein
VLDVAFSLALLVMSCVLLGPGRTILPWAGVRADKAIPHIEARAASFASTATPLGYQRGRSSSLGSSVTIPSQQQQVKRVGGTPQTRTTAAAGSYSPTALHGGGSGVHEDGDLGPLVSPYHGLVPNVSTANERDFASCAEPLFDFISDVVRSVSPTSSVSSAGSHR